MSLFVGLSGSLRRLGPMVIFGVSMFFSAVGGAGAEDRIGALERQLVAIQEELVILKKAQATEKSRAEQERQALAEAIAGRANTPGLPGASEKIRLGGYGEHHFNLTENGAKSADPHRLVFYLGYDFADWIKFNSETELEHGFVEEGNGALVLEQANVDFLLGERFNVRMGRVLLPIGIVNERHEPPTFAGVERPSFNRSVVPTTWSADGIGFFGTLNPRFKYRAYLTNGLDGSGFSKRDGIRGGRLEERPGLDQPAATIKGDWNATRDLRLGAAYFRSGIGNGNNGAGVAARGETSLVAVDGEFNHRRFELRGEGARILIDGKGSLPASVAREILGWYLQAGYRFFDPRWRRGKLSGADALAFIRFDSIDTQRRMQAGAIPDPAQDRTEWTLGLNFFPTRDFVIKADYQWRDNRSDLTVDRVDNALNLGFGYMF